MPSPTRPDGDRTDTIRIGDLETLRVLSDPLRMRMVDLMSRGEWTAKALSAALGVSQTRLYHHLSRLEEHGLVRVTATRLVSGIVEKSYAATGSRISVDPLLFTAGSPAPTEVAMTLDGLVAAAFETVRREIELSIEAGAIDPADHTRGERRLMISHDAARMTPAAAAEFQARLELLIDEFGGAGGGDSADAADGGANPDDSYRLLLAFYRAAPALPATDVEPKR